ncbi:MAG TPA: hypothetical protein P5514_01375 [Bacteroidales bacterium]|nr:hypothetical protein [Bacteroidales bacterium]HRX95567.1 hypothetical protein [Bacteroidales bacterium]
MNSIGNLSSQSENFLHLLTTAVNTGLRLDYKYDPLKFPSNFWNDLYNECDHFVEGLPEVISNFDVKSSSPNSYEFAFKELDKWFSMINWVESYIKHNVDFIQLDKNLLGIFAVIKEDFNIITNWIEIHLNLSKFKAA